MQSQEQVSVGLTDQQRFRKALGRYATGVSIITAGAPDGGLIGITVSSFNSVSLDPPLVSFNLDRRALSLDALIRAPGFAINVLGHHQQPLSDKFARQSSGKWDSVTYDTGFAGAPLIQNALARFECEQYAQYDGGDHVIFLGRVVHFESNELGEPLIFFSSSYRRLEVPKGCSDCGSPQCQQRVATS